MTTRRSTLVALVSLVIITGIALSLKPFVAYLGPSATAGRSLTRISIEQLQPGGIVILDLEQRTPYGRRYMVIKNDDDTLNVFALPIRDGLVGMPDVSWWRLDSYWCHDFGPELNHGRVVPSGIISCRDPELRNWADWNQSELRWTLDGKNLGSFTEDIPRAPFTIEYGEIVIKQR